MTGTPIQNCHLRFQFKCPKQWEALQETAEAGVRFCGQCHKQVYLCQNEQEAAQHARAGHCVAVPVGLVSPKHSPDEREHVEALAREHGLPVIPLHGHEIDPELLKFVSLELALQYGVVPLRREGASLVVAMSDPSSTRAVDNVRFVTGYNVEVVLASRQDIQEALERAHREQSRQRQVELGVVFCEEEPEPDMFEGVVGRIIRMMLLDGHRKNEEQFQVELTDSEVVVRYGLAGNRRDFMRPPLKLRDELLRQLRHAANALPGQEGQVHIRERGQRIAYQVQFNATDRGQEVILQRLS